MALCLKNVGSWYLASDSDHPAHIAPRPSTFERQVAQEGSVTSRRWRKEVSSREVRCRVGDGKVGE